MVQEYYSGLKQCFRAAAFLQDFQLMPHSSCAIIPSLTLVKSKSGYKPSSYAGCSHFLCGTDLCYFFPSSVLVLFIMLRMADFEINS